MTVEQAKEIVRKAYADILEREPDYPGAQGYVDALVDGRADEAFVRAELKKSEEYISRFVTKTVPEPSPAGQVPPGGEPFDLGDNWMLIAGALVLFLFLMRR